MGGDFGGGGEEFFPVEVLAGDEGGDVGDVNEPFPEMFGAVNGDKYEFVFERESRDGVAVKRDLDLPAEELLDGKRPGMVAEGFLGMQLNEKFGAGMAKDVFAGNFLRLNRSDGNARFVAESEHQFGGAKDVAIANDEIEIAILTEAGVGIAALRENRAFDHQSFDLRAGEIPKEAKHLRGEIQSKESLTAAPTTDLIETLWGNGEFIAGK